MTMGARKPRIHRRSNVATLSGALASALASARASALAHVTLANRHLRCTNSPPPICEFAQEVNGTVVSVVGATMEE